MILSDKDIRQALRSGHLKIETVLDSNIQPSSVDLRLGQNFVRFRPGFGPVNVAEGYSEDDKIKENRAKEGYVTVRAGEFILAHTAEKVHIPPNLTARVEGRSSIGRLGVTMHVTAGYIDPGFVGQITLEIANLSKRSVVIPVGYRVCQIVFETMTSPADKPYGHKDLKSHYQGQEGAVPSR